MSLLFYIFLVGLAGILYVVAKVLSPQKAPITKFLKPSLEKKYKLPKHWKGIPIDAKNRFVNHEFPFYQDYTKVLRWLPGHLINLLRNISIKTSVINHHTADFLEINNSLVWLGHASFFLRVDGVNVLIDPQFNNTSLYHRHTKNPIPIHLFDKIDYILISHDHLDHCDQKTLASLFHQNPKVTVLTGLKTDILIRSLSKENIKIQTAEWYEQYLVEGKVKFYFVPSRHYCHRLGSVYNSRLWGGFVLNYNTEKNERRTIYFAGDSGYGTHFGDIGNLFHPDIAIIGIGAFLPGWFMHPNHTSPFEAVQAYRDTKAKTFVPMHHSTFNLGSEPIRKPIKSLEKLRHEVDGIMILKPGEILKLEDLEK